LSEDLAVKRLEEALLTRKIAELEEDNANLKIEKESTVAGYCRLSDKYKTLEAKMRAAKKKKAEAEKLCIAQVAEVEKKLVKEAYDYIEYHLKFWRSVHTLHEILVASLSEIRAPYLFPSKNAPNEEFFNWFEDEVKSLSGVFWQLNDNFVVLDMLHSLSCRELPNLHQLEASSDALIVEVSLWRCKKLLAALCAVGGKTTVYRRLFDDWRKMM
jgi:hypothetical protein